MCTHNLCFEQKKRKLSFLLAKKFHFNCREKSLYIAWTCFRNVHYCMHLIEASLYGRPSLFKEFSIHKPLYTHKASTLDQIIHVVLFFTSFSHCRQFSIKSYVVDIYLGEAAILMDTHNI